MSTISGSDRLEVQLAPGDLIAQWDPELVVEIEAAQFNTAPHTHVRVAPRNGHHYPIRALRGIPQDVVGERQVFRYLSPTASGGLIDLNVPLAGSDIQLRAQPADVSRTQAPGWDANSLRTRLLQFGPGLQARREDVVPDWPTPADLKREDEGDDAVFYAAPRFVTHIDDTTIAQVSKLYARLIHPGARVLDIMSSWISHLPADVRFEKVTGLGMNHQELAANPVLDEMRVHDLNHDTRLPFADHSFDAVVCAVSVEYLADPIAVFADVRRVLAPGGIFINAFSNRCFPTKAIALWAKLHEFERLGLVAHFFHRSGYSRVNTWSLRGLPRPSTEPNTSGNSESDPVYAVWASS